jgi:hypothetical protein
MNERSNKHSGKWGGAVVHDVIYLAVTVVVFAVIWAALRGVEKL